MKKVRRSLVTREKVANEMEAAVGKSAEEQKEENIKTLFKYLAHQQGWLAKALDLLCVHPTAHNFIGNVRDLKRWFEKCLNGWPRWARECLCLYYYLFLEFESLETQRNHGKEEGDGMKGAMTYGQRYYFLNQKVSDLFEAENYPLELIDRAMVQKMFLRVINEVKELSSQTKDDLCKLISPHLTFIEEGFRRAWNLPILLIVTESYKQC